MSEGFFDQAQVVNCSINSDLFKIYQVIGKDGSRIDPEMYEDVIKYDSIGKTLTV